MKKKLLPIFLGIIVLSSCNKDYLDDPKFLEKPCITQSGNPTDRSYIMDSVIAYSCTSKHCGVLPLSTKNYWVYEDSIFNDGTFSKVQFDTLRFSKNWKSLTDNLVWWESNIEIGLPAVLYANDSSIFSLTDRFFTPGIKDAKKDYSLFQGDSLKYLANFEDAAAQGKSIKISSTISTPAGNFNNNIYFEKNARNYRKDQVYFNPGIGVIKYIQEKAPIGQRIIKLQKISTLINFHIE
ncbi:MAG: hypothetical protein WBC06_00460 [Chitinophagaceae bacterium]